MPSEKPNFEEIGILLRKRNQYYQQRKNIYFELQYNCASVVEGGAINKAEAKKLLDFIESDKKTITIFPNKLLHEVLLAFCENKKSADNVEEILLEIISNLYINEIDQLYIAEISEVGIKPLTLTDRPDLIRPPKIDHFMIKELFCKFPFRNELNYYLYNTSIADVIIKDRFLGFTGAFENFTRKTCFEKVRILGSVPSDPADYLDYLFVANKLVKESIISSKMATAIFHQRVYGNPLIFTEDDWNSIIEIHTMK